MRETPSRVMLDNSSTPSIVLMISSSGLVTLVSISSGEAPRNVVVTVMIGSSTLGNWSIPMLLSENQPSTTMNRLIIVAKTGRLMQRSAMPTPLCSGTAAGGGGTGSALFMGGRGCGGRGFIRGAG